jgi:phosphohistidine phosphatase
MKLYFLRHTAASDVAPSDAERPLTLKGEKQAQTAGRALAELGVQPTCILSSPFLRARQTAAILAQQLGFAEPIKVIAELENGTPTADLLRVLSPASDAVILMVGHMPGLADHVAALVGATNSDAYAFGKGSVACIEAGCMTVGSAKLLWLKHLDELLANLR